VCRSQGTSVPKNLFGGFIKSSPSSKNKGNIFKKKKYSVVIAQASSCNYSFKNEL
jgi:hypothetical protein